MKRQQLAYFVLLTLLLFVANNESVFGQGKLARVRDAVRHSKPSSEPKEEPKPKEPRAKNHEYQQRDTVRHDDHREFQRTLNGSVAKKKPDQSMTGLG